MFNKTKNLKKIVFTPAAIISALLTSLLFYQFGSNVFTGIIFVFFGLSIQAYQIMSLLEWKNSLLRKKLKYSAFIIYLFVTFSSGLATLAFGVKEIDKRILVDSLKMPEIEMLENRVKERQALISNNNKTEYVENIKKQIEAYQNKIPLLTYNIAERTTMLNIEIEKLNRHLLEFENRNNDQIFSEISQMKSDLAEKKKNLQSMQGAFEILSNVFMISTKGVMVIFLFFITISLELMIYSTSGIFDGEKSKKIKKIKKKSNGQLSMLDFSKRNQA